MERKFKKRKHSFLRKLIQTPTALSVEQHSKRKFCTKSKSPRQSIDKLEIICAQQGIPLTCKSRKPSVSSPSRTHLKTWADLSIPSNPVVNQRRKSSSALAKSPVNLNRIPMTSQPPITLASSYHSPSIRYLRDQSTESGYLSSNISNNSNSTPCSPRGSTIHPKKPPFRSKTVDHDNYPQAEELLNNVEPVKKVPETAKEKRKQLQKSTGVFFKPIRDDEHCLKVADNEGMSPKDHSSSWVSVFAPEDHAIEQLDDDLASSFLGEWSIPYSELTFRKKIVDGGSWGHDVYSGRWHGDVVIHSYKLDQKPAIDSCLADVRSLMHIRHENIVLYMGMGINPDERGNYAIVTNPVRAESLHSTLRSNIMKKLDVIRKMSIGKQIANAIGYLHAKNIIHGRICSRNVFLESKIQLSLLDYAIGSPNIVYSSPELITRERSDLDLPIPHYMRGKTQADDVFAFGTLLFELFSGHLPFSTNAGSSYDLEIVEKILNGNMPQCLKVLDACITEKLKRLIHHCWSYEECRRPTIGQILPHFEPGSCLLRRHSTSEPRLNQTGRDPSVLGVVRS